LGSRPDGRTSILQRKEHRIGRTIRVFRGFGTMATMKGIVIMVLLFFAVIALMQSLLTLLWSLYPVGVHESANGVALFAMGIGFFATSIFVWKKWEDEEV